MTNYTMNNEKKAIDEHDFDELDIVSGGTCIDGIREVVDKTSSDGSLINFRQSVNGTLRVI